MRSLNLAGGLQSRAADLLGLGRPTLRLELQGILAQQASGQAEAAAADDAATEWRAVNLRALCFSLRVPEAGQQSGHRGVPVPLRLVLFSL